MDDLVEKKLAKLREIAKLDKMSGFTNLQKRDNEKNLENLLTILKKCV